MSEAKNYSREYLALLNELVKINKQIIVEKKDDSIFVNRNNEAIAYTLSADKSNFDFEGNDIAFYEFSEFFQLFNTFKEPEIIQDKSENSSKIILKQNRSKITYKLSDGEALEPGHDGIDIEEEVAILKLTKQELQEIRKMASVLKAKYIEFVIDGEEVLVKCSNLGVGNSWDNVYSLESEAKQNVKLIFNSEIIDQIPDNDYTIHFDARGLADFEYVSDKVNLNIYIVEENVEE